MIAFITTSVPTLVKMRERTWHVGRLLTPRMASALDGTTKNGLPWAADNDGFNGVKVGPYLRMLSLIAETPEGCRFVVLPDKVSDARETLRLYLKWQEIVREDLGLPGAFVLQDGIEGAGVPWDLTEAIFIGGTTHFKLSGIVRRLAQEAKERGKWLHMGRVNTPDRAFYARSIGCDSFDGSQWGRFPERDLDELVMILQDDWTPGDQATIGLDL